MREAKILSLFLISFFLFSGLTAAQTNESEEDGREVLVELDKATWIQEINWDPANQSLVEVTIQSDVPKLVSLQEIPDYQGRSGSFSPMKSYNLNSGKNTVMVPYNGRTTQGIALTDSNDGAYYRKQPNSIPDPGPIDAIFIGVYGAASTFLIFISMRGWSKFQLKRGLIRE